MRMFRSFILRLTLILSSTATLCLALMVATLAIQEQGEAMGFCALLFGVLLFWVLFNLYVVRKTDPELTVEVAWAVLPAGAILSVALSVMMALFLEEMIPGDEGREHWILPLGGLGVALFLAVRCLDIKWLRGEEEILALEARDK